MRSPIVAVNMDLAKAWVEKSRELARDLKLKDEPSLELIAKIPDLFTIRSDDQVSDSEKQLVKSLVQEAAQGCDRERVREGEALKKELMSLCARLEDLAVTAQTLRDEANAELERRLKDRLDEQLKKKGIDLKLDEQRLAHEIVLHLDRADISEELSRLREHLKAYRALVKSSEAQGKKLDFYAQELLREVNTIGSKSHIARLTQAVVEAKTLVEKIREQVQNVE